MPAGFIYTFFTQIILKFSIKLLLLFELEDDSDLEELVSPATETLIAVSSLLVVGSRLVLNRENISNRTVWSDLLFTLIQLMKWSLFFFKRRNCPRTT